jgi:hypothetical protein
LFGHNATVRITHRDEPALRRARNRESILDAADNRHTGVQPRVIHEVPRWDCQKTNVTLAVAP